MSVCLSASPRGYLRNHKRDLYYLCMLPMTVARSSYGFVAIRYVLLVLLMLSYLFYNGPKDRFRLNLLIYRKV